MLIVMAGLPGTGKSTLARALADALPAAVLDKDTVRAALFPAELIEYSTEQDDFCMSVIFQVTGYIARKHPERTIILDGRTFSRQYQVHAVKELAARLHTELKIIECICSDETAYKRLSSPTTTDAKTGRQHPAGNRDYALYLAIKARFEPIQEPKLVVNTDNDPARCLAEALSFIA